MRRGSNKRPVERSDLTLIIWFLGEKKTADRRSLKPGDACYLKTAEYGGPRRIRSLSAASWSKREAVGAEPRAFSSKRKEMSSCNKMAASLGPGGQTHGSDVIRLLSIKPVSNCGNFQSLMRCKQTNGVTPLLPGPEPPELGVPPGPPSGPLDFGDDSSPPSEKQTLHHLLHPFKILLLLLKTHDFFFYCPEMK